jgi:hypothetical protein
MNASDFTSGIARGIHDALDSCGRFDGVDLEVTGAWRFTFRCPNRKCIGCPYDDGVQAELHFESVAVGESVGRIARVVLEVKKHYRHIRIIIYTRSRASYLRHEVVHMRKRGDDMGKWLGLCCTIAADVRRRHPKDRKTPGWLELTSENLASYL